AFVAQSARPGRQVRAEEGDGAPSAERDSVSPQDGIRGAARTLVPRSVAAAIDGFDSRAAPRRHRYFQSTLLEATRRPAPFGRARFQLAALDAAHVRCILAERDAGRRARFRRTGGRLKMA